MKIFGNDKKLVDCSKQLVHSFLKKKTSTEERTKSRLKKKKIPKFNEISNLIRDHSSLTEAHKAFNFTVRTPYKISHERLPSFFQQGEQLNNFEMPKTPHNTTQYLTSNHYMARHESVMNCLTDYHHYLHSGFTPFILDEIYSVDDICLTGGSMKGIVNSNNLDARGGTLSENEQTWFQLFRQQEAVQEQKTTICFQQQLDELRRKEPAP